MDDAELPRRDDIEPSLPAADTAPESEDEPTYPAPADMDAIREELAERERKANASRDLFY